MRALLYLRQSDSDGAGEGSLSIDSQATVLREDAARFGWTVAAEVRDADLKGYDEGRPGLLTLYERCRGGGVDLVAFWKLDRLARLLRLQENVLHELDLLGVAVYSNQDPHLGTPLFRHVLGAFNEELTRMISANVKRALRERTRRGEAHGVAPYGYRRAPGAHRPPKREGGIGGPLVIDEPAAAVVRELFVWRAGGASLGEIAARLHDAGIPSPGGAPWWPKRSLAYLLGNPAYRGSLCLSGVAVADTHPPLVDAATWEAAQRAGGAPALAGRTRHPRDSKRDRSWLDGLILHACGQPMYATGPAPSKPVALFRCRVGAGWGSAPGGCPVSPRQMHREQAEALVWDRLCADLAALRTHREAVREMQTLFRATAPGAAAARRAAADQLHRLEARRERWLELYAGGDIERARFDAESARIASERAEAEVTLAALPAAPDAEALSAVWRKLRDVRETLPLLDGEARAHLLRALGVAIVGPAGYRVGHGDGRPGPHHDPGRATIRYHPPFASLLGDRDR